MRFNHYEFGSPKIKINKKWIKSESGEQVELLLFGRVTSIVKLKEISDFNKESIGKNSNY